VDASPVQLQLQQRGIHTIGGRDSRVREGVTALPFGRNGRNIWDGVTTLPFGIQFFNGRVR
jgi:hypothetical protein